MNRLARLAIAVALATRAAFPAYAQSGDGHHYFTSASFNGHTIYFYMQHPRSRSDRILGLNTPPIKPAIVWYAGCDPKLCTAWMITAEHTMTLVLDFNDDVIYYAVYGPDRQQIGEIAMLRPEPGSVLGEIWDDVRRGKLIASPP